MDIEGFKELFQLGTKVRGVFLVLEDQQWHCRECEYRHLNITQIAGGSGIQGLERGTASRQGLVIESENHFCVECDRQTRQDKWTGQFKTAIQASGMSSRFVKWAVSILNNRDIVEETERPINQLTLDHKLPMIRWGENTKSEQNDYKDMTENDVKRIFQLLKKSNGSTSHNLLKSRACERCYRQGKRGKPFGIDFFYKGEETWHGETKKDASGCIGCGWYDFAEWRKKLNETLRKEEQS